MITDFKSIEPSSIPFANAVLKKFDSKMYEHVRTRSESVDLSKVLGTEHPDYGGYTWGELMPVGPWGVGPRGEDLPPGKLKKSELKLAQLKREQQPGYYLKMDLERPTWYFYRLGEVFFIGDGNNRTVIGRVFLTVNNLPTVVHKVKVTAQVSEFK